MPAPTPTITRAAYRRLREIGAPRPDAARRLGISYKTAQRLDADTHTCPRCGQPRGTR